MPEPDGPGLAPWGGALVQSQLCTDRLGGCSLPRIPPQRGGLWGRTGACGVWGHIPYPWPCSRNSGSHRNCDSVSRCPLGRGPRSRGPVLAVLLTGRGDGVPVTCKASFLCLSSLSPPAAGAVGVVLASSDEARVQHSHVA